MKRLLGAHSYDVDSRFWLAFTRRQRDKENGHAPLRDRLFRWRIRRAARDGVSGGGGAGGAVKLP